MCPDCRNLLVLQKTAIVSVWFWCTRWVYICKGSVFSSDPHTGFISPRGQFNTEPSWYWSRATVKMELELASWAAASKACGPAPPFLNDQDSGKRSCEGRISYSLNSFSNSVVRFQRRFHHVLMAELTFLVFWRKMELPLNPVVEWLPSEDVEC